MNGQGGFMGLFCNEKGQMTIELALAFPVLMIVAMIAVNALEFFSICASFDRAVHDQVRIVAVSPAYNQTVSQSRSLIESSLKETFQDCSNIDLSVSYQSVEVNLEAFTATLKFYPTLFGLGFKNEIFGVALPSLNHSSRFVVDIYKPGVFV